MANEKTYPNYLMHYRTKGSKNGVSTTKGYTAVGHKANGHLVNGRYVYELGAPGSYRPKAVNSRNGRSIKKLTFDTPKSYGAHPETNEDTYMIRDGKNVYETPSVPAGVATYPAKKKDWAKEAASYSNHVGISPQGGFDAEMLRKREKWLSDKAQAQGAANNWQQQANAAASGKPSGYNKAHYNAVSQAAAERKAREAALKRQKKASLRNAAAKGANNNWQQRANKEAGKGLAYDKTTTHGSYINARGERAYTTDNPKKWEDEREARWKRTDAAKAESQLRNSRSDIGNAFADLKEDAKNTFKALKSKFKKKKK